MYTLYRETVVQTTMERAWEFIRNPANLNLITPDDMKFEIISDLPEVMVEGMLVEYRVRIPFIGSRPWLSELKHIVHGHSFVDEQRIGPYKLWYHYHSLEPAPNGVRFTDRVTYETPFGIIGKAANRIFIARTLRRIFDYREQRLIALLSGNENPEPWK